jgi:hypothetical protein
VPNYQSSKANHYLPKLLSHLQLSIKDNW